MIPQTAELHLRVVGALLLAVAALGVAVHRHFGWGAEIQRLTLLTRQVFLIHSAFVTVVLVMLGVLLAAYAPALVAPGPLPRAVLVGLLIMWAARLLAQWFFYDPSLWRGDRLRTFMHVLFSVIYTYFVATFAMALYAQHLGVIR
jgi:hypothetical protein